MNKKFGLIATIVLLAGAMVACASPAGYSPQYQRNDTGYDQVFSVGVRGNGAGVIWFVHDDTTAYCTTNNDLIDGIKAMNDLLPLATVRFNYKGDGSPVEASPCARVEDIYGDDKTANWIMELGDDISFDICGNWVGVKDLDGAKSIKKQTNWPLCDKGSQR